VPANWNFVTSSSGRLQYRILKVLLLELIPPSDRNGELSNSTDYRKFLQNQNFMKIFLVVQTEGLVAQHERETA
jgi:hypothetical protein